MTCPAMQLGRESEGLSQAQGPARAPPPCLPTSAVIHPAADFTVSENSVGLSAHPKRLTVTNLDPFQKTSIILYFQEKETSRNIF